MSPSSALGIARIADARETPESMTDTVSVTLHFSVRFTKDASGWWEATSRYGSTTAATREACVDILKERAIRGY